MNPCDHPHGGGEGKKSPPAAACSPWGWLTKNSSTNRKLFEKKRLKLFKLIR
jgi:large subunit ribosomal protein L2